MNNAAPDWTPATFQGQPPQSAGNDSLDLGELVSLIWNRKWIIALIAAIVTLFGIFQVQTATKLYRAEATLILEEKKQNAAGFEGLVGGLSDEDSELNSQIEVIRSRSIVGRTVDQLSLQLDPEFVAALRERSLMGKTVNWLLANTVGAFSSSTGSSTGGSPEQSARESAIDELIEALSVSVIPKTHVFRIRLETESAEKSALIVNTLSDAFVADQVASRILSTQQAADWLATKVSTLGETLATAEAAAADYRSNTERNVTKADVAASNISLKNARGRKSSFLTNLLNQTGSSLPRTDRDIRRLESFEDEILQLEEIVAKQTTDLLTLRQLDREAEAAGAIYGHFVTRLNEIEVQKGLQEADVRILSAAIPRYQPTSPRKVMTVFMAGVIGLLLGTAFVVLSRLMDRSFTDPSALQQSFGIPVIGSIPRAPAKNRRDLLVYALKRPASAIMESVRDLRTSLMARSKGIPASESGRDGQVLLVTSSVPSEGKTTTTILLAVNSAALAKKVLLIECDMRRSTFQSYFGRPTNLGLIDAIDGQEGWEEAIWTEPKTGADIVFGGRAVGRNAADVFASAEFETFVERMRQDYDLIILDAPPVLPVPDARLIAKVSDAVVYVVRSASTPHSTVAAGLRLFENIGIKVDGLTLTQMKKGSGYGAGYGAGNKYYDN